MKSDMLLAVMQLAAERDLPQDAVISAFEDAIAAAYRRENEADGYDIVAHLDPETGQVVINTVLHVVETVDEDEREARGQITVSSARSEFSPKAVAGDDIIIGELAFTPQRIAARTVNQVLQQRLRSAEKRIVFEEFADKEGEVISAPIRRVDPARNNSTSGARSAVMVDLGKADAVLPGNEQPLNERYRVGMELRFFVLRVGRTSRDGDGGPEIVLSRTHPYLLRRLIEMEVPEVKNGIVEIKSIAREAGARSKVAVYSNKHDIDPIGACVGLRGIRIQTIVTELMGEKIDILEWSEDRSTFIANALGPAQVDKIILLSDDNAEVVVPDSQLSLAIGRDGQNVGLATKLTGFHIDIKSTSEYAEEQIALQREMEAETAAQAAKAAEERIAEEQELQAAQVETQPDSVSDTEIEDGSQEEAHTEPAQEQEIAAEVTETAPTQPTEEEEPEVPVVPHLFVPESHTQVAPEPEPVEAEIEEELEPEPEQDEEALDFQLMEIEEKIRELEEKEKLQAEQAAQEQDIDSDDLWVLPDELATEAEPEKSGIRFAEDIDDFRDGGGTNRRSGNRRDGQRSSGR